MSDIQRLSLFGGEIKKEESVSGEDKLIALVSNRPYTLYGIKDPSVEVCKAAISSNPSVLCLVKNKTHELVELFLQTSFYSYYDLPKEWQDDFSYFDESMRGEPRSNRFDIEHIGIGVNGTNIYFHNSPYSENQDTNARVEQIEKYLCMPMEHLSEYCSRIIDGCELLKYLLQDIKSGVLLDTFVGHMRDIETITAFGYEDCKIWNDKFCSVLSDTSDADSIKNIIMSFYPEYKDFADLQRSNIGTDFCEIENIHRSFYNSHIRANGSKNFLEKFDFVLGVLLVYCHDVADCVMPKIPNIYALYVLTVIYSALAI